MINVSIKEYFTKFYNMTPYLNIDESEWSYIIKTWNQDDILDTLAEVCLSYPLPIPIYDESVIRDDFNNLKTIKAGAMISNDEWFARNSENSKYSLKFDNDYLLLKKSPIGNKASAMFHNIARWSVDHDRNSSGFKSWSTKEGIISILKAYFSLDQVLKSVNMDTLKTATTLRKYVAAQFKPSVAKVFFDLFNSKNVLDFSTGWGDRFAGFYAADTTLNYVGIDPNGANTPNYWRQDQFYKKCQTFFENQKTSYFMEIGAEDADLKMYEDYFDTVFTSPPYFNVERYSTDPRQSYIRYRDIDSWNKNFLHKSIENLYPTIKSGGILAVNIADVYLPKIKNYCEIVNPMNDFISGLPGMKYRGAIGMQMTKRFNSGGAGTAVSDYYSDESKQKREATRNIAFAEPIWVWQKD
jgi:hypothetical protein